MTSPAILYRKEETIYSGARCVVFRAHAEDNGAPVVVKALRSEPAPADEVARLKCEYELLCGMHLPGVIGCLDFITGANRHLMVLEDFGAQSLDQLSKRDPIDLLSFLEIAYAASTALASLHERHIVHGNVSPSNILFNPQTGQLKLIDFGSAIHLSGGTKEHSSRPSGHPTHRKTNDEGRRTKGANVPSHDQDPSSLVAGPVDEVELTYASPEQIDRLAADVEPARGGAEIVSTNGFRDIHKGSPNGAATVIDGRSDLYSLGVTLYELLTGRLPSADEGAAGTQDDRPMPPHRLRVDIPERLSEILLKLIEKDPAQRYQSASELAADLAAASMSELAGLHRTVRRESMRREHSLLALQEAYDEVEAQAEDLKERQAELAEVRSQIEVERQRYQELFALAPDGYLVTDLSGTMRDANQAACTLLGVDPQFAPGLMLTVFVPTHEERQNFLDFLRQIGKSDATLEWDGRLKPEGREPVDVVVRCSAVRESDGIATEIRWLIRDVTSRKRAEEAMRLSEERFRTLAENGRDVTYRLRLQPVPAFDYISPSVTSLTGFTPEELYADSDVTHTLILPEDLPVVKDTLGGVDNALTFLELRWRRKDGGVVWTEQRNAPIYDEAGNLVALTGVVRDITARKLAQDALREREYLIEKINASSPHLIYIYDLAKRHTVYTNQRLAERLGYPVDEDQILGLDYMLKIIHPEDRPRAAAHMAAMAVTPDNASISIEVRVLDAHGNYRWISTRYVVFARNPDGSVAQVLGTLEDVTERKAVENALRESEERFRTSVENMEDAFGIYSALRDESGHIVDFKIEYLNRVACLLNNARFEELVGRTLGELLPADQQSLLDKYRKVVETGQPLRTESQDFDAQFRDRRISLALDLRATRYGDGFVATWRDVTERKKREELLLEREQFIEHIAEVTPGIIYVYDMVEGRVVYVNDQVKTLTGFAPDEVLNLGTDVQSEFAYNDGSPGQDVLDRRLRQARDGEVVEFEYNVAHKDGTSRWVLTRAVVFARDDAGVPRQMLGVANDITERRRIEETVRQANRELNARVDELSALNRISQPLTTISDLSSSLPAVCRVLLDIFNASAVSMLELVSPGDGGRASGDGEVANTERLSPNTGSGATLRVLAHVRRGHSGPEMTGRPIALNDDPAAYRVVTDEQPVIEYRISGDEYVVMSMDNPHLDGNYWVLGTRMVLPLRARGATIGLLSIAGMSNADFGMRNGPEKKIPKSEFDIPQPTVWSPSDVRLAQTVAGMVASAVATARLFTRELKTRLLAESLNEVGIVLTSSLDIDTVVHTIFEQLKRVVDYRGAALLLRDGDDLIETQAVGIAAPYVGQRLTAPLNGPQIEVLQSGQGRCVSDTRDYRDWTPPGGNKLIRSWMGAPLVIGERTLGILTVSHTRRKTYSAEHLRLLQAFANEAAIAINNATRYQEAFNIAAYEERNRLARELHDSVTQSLFSANLVAKVLPDLVKNSPDRFDQAVKTLGQLTQTALAEMRTMLLELRPTSLTQAPLDSAFKNLILTVTSRSPFEVVHTTFDPTPALPGDIQLGLYRIVQETLTNVAKHSQARHVEFDLRVLPPFQQSNPRYWKGEIAIHIADDGIGFHVEAVPEGHLGLQIMRERAASIGAKLEITSEPGHGTQLTLVWAGETAAQEET